ncbi:heavy metal sensor histidine kinase [Pseudomonas sp. NPDC047963]|nr:heavy metal sensor histidine kinase [Pseudomonas sp.]
MKVLPRSLSLRLALMFALVSTALLGAIGFYLYQSLEREIAWRDDQALLGRLERMAALLDDSDSIEVLRERPQLYANMLGNRDSLLWVLGESGAPLIEINPVQLAIPQLPPADHPRLEALGDQARLAWIQIERPRGGLTLIAGKLLGEREQMLAAYRLKLWLALATGALLAFLLGWLVSERGLRPVRQLTRRALAIDVQHLHLRIEDSAELSELRALSEALNQMLARLEAGFAQLSRFSEDLAHEMRTPLSNLMGQTQQTLRRVRSLEDYQSLLASNQEEYERLARMINNMLFLARTEQVDAAIHRQDLDLAETVEQLGDYFEGVAEEHQMRVVNEASGSLHVDPDLLRRALANLIANALRYGATGTEVRVSCERTADNVVITVENSGEPIAEEHLPRLFDRFYRCDPSRAQPGDSGGLGLAIVRSIMQLHGGEVRVTSDASVTCFSLSFPR